jgi:hypothetical protein
VRDFELKNTDDMEAVIHSVLKGDHVLVDDRNNFNNYLACLPKNRFRQDCQRPILNFAPRGKI